MILAWAWHSCECLRRVLPLFGDGSWCEVQVQLGVAWLVMVPELTVVPTMSCDLLCQP